MEGESSVFELEVLWKKQEVDDDTVEEHSVDAPQFVIEDDDDSETGDDRGHPPQTSEKPKSRKQLPSLGERLFSCIIDLLFCCGFTLPSKIQVDHYKINYVIWWVWQFSWMIAY